MGIKRLLWTESRQVALTFTVSSWVFAVTSPHTFGAAHLGPANIVRLRLSDLFLIITVSCVACALTQLPNTSFFEVSPIVSFALAAWFSASYPTLSCRFIAMAWIWAASNAMSQFQNTFHMLASSSRPNTWAGDLVEHLVPCVLRDAILVGTLSLPALLAMSRSKTAMLRDVFAPLVSVLGAILSVSAAMAFSYWLLTWRP
jgi:hypothetical protein